MGKESSLLKAIKEKDAAKVQKLLKVKRKRSESLSWQSVDSEQGIQVELKHINVNVHEDGTGYTPLLLAVLYGSKEIAEKLIFHCADVKAKDNKGNTALHLAVFHGSLDLMELLLFNHAEVNAQNDDGNTALHIACQAVIDERVKIIIKLVTAGVNVWTKNKYSLTALDVSAQFKRNDAITTLLEYVPALKDNRTAIIEASIRGFESTVELLLEYGIHCNNLDENYGSSALHEAVRYNRCKVVQILLSFQADPTLLNLKLETSRSLALHLPPSSAEIINTLFKEHSEKMIRTPKKIKNTDTCSSQDCNSTTSIIKNFPELPNDITWTKNHPLFCSSCTEKNPNTHILDGNMSTFWVIPVIHHAWTILDLHAEHFITGITVFGWNSPQMLKTFQLQTSESAKGPWTVVSSHTCQPLGSSDPRESACAQKFSGFTFRSRYIRLYIVDNHNGTCICFQGIHLHGVDCRVIDTLKGCGLYTNIDSFLLQGTNTWKGFLDVTPAIVDDLVTDPVKKETLWKAVHAGRRVMYPMTVLAWLTPPALSVTAGETLPDFSVQSDSGATEVVQLVVQGAEISGNTYKRLSPTGERKPSIAVFSEISLSPAGVYTLLVKGVTTDITLISPLPTEVKPRVIPRTDVAAAFDEIQQMLREAQSTLT